MLDEFSKIVEIDVVIAIEVARPLAAVQHAVGVAVIPVEFAVVGNSVAVAIRRAAHQAEGIQTGLDDALRLAIVDCESQSHPVGEDDAGVVEVTLLGQTVNHYRYEHGAAITLGGIEQPQKGRSYQGGHRRDPFAGTTTTTFADLLKRIHDEVPAIQRLRFVTSYPRDFGDDVLEVIRDSPRICRYLHIPAQSGSDAVLKRMNRGYTVAEYLDFIDRARAFLDQPEIGRPLMLAGDIIAGFCGETEEDYEATVRLVERWRFKNSFIFKYSERPGTKGAERLPDDVPLEIKKRRNNELLRIQNAISEEDNQQFLGRQIEVLVEGLSKQARDVPEDAHVVQMTGRTHCDRIVVFNGNRRQAGQILPIAVYDVNAHTLFGEVVTESVGPEVFQLG
ncbi:MAG: radical SAM protein [Bdellovibrionales bacterium]|nr:radical SAM protein [Bdellovibrionales bacterium]